MIISFKNVVCQNKITIIVLFKGGSKKLPTKRLAWDCQIPGIIRAAESSRGINSPAESESTLKRTVITGFSLLQYAESL